MLNLEEIRGQGVVARLTTGIWDNPYLAAEMMPAKTGEAIEEWRAKFEAWEHGWDLGAPKRIPPEIFGLPPKQPRDNPDLLQQAEDGQLQQPSAKPL
jgi:hypothetical protein